MDDKEIRDHLERMTPQERERICQFGRIIEAAHRRAWGECRARALECDRMDMYRAHRRMYVLEHLKRPLRPRH